MNKLLSSSLLCALLVSSATCTWAQTSTPLNFSNAAPQERKDPNTTLEELGWLDRNKIDQEISLISELVQTKLGRSLRKDLSDLDALQAIIDRELVKRDDYETQQAMGAVMAQVFLADFPNTLEWKVYRDSLGRSRALCAKGTQECLFPITMLSRRMEVGSKPDVKKIYAEAIALMEPFLPKMPYGNEILYRLPRH